MGPLTNIHAIIQCCAPVIMVLGGGARDKAFGRCPRCGSTFEQKVAE